nr:sensor domain-containing diguanylate cyclase [Spirochaetota bacterium]
MTRSSFKAAKSGDYLSYLQPFVETVTNKILETDRIFGRFFELNDFSSRRFDGRFLIPNLVDNIPMPIFINDEDFRFVECNLAFQNFVGVAKEQIIEKTIFDVFPSHIGFEVQKEEDEVRKNNQKIDCECNFFLNDKELDMNLSVVPLVDDKKKLYGFIGILNDITGFKSNEKSLKILSITDELTGLYNRRGLRELTQRELKLCVRNKSDFSVIMLDIDFFKLYNDNYGHSFGDICLQTVANVLKK